MRDRHVDRLCSEIVRNALSTLINLTKCEREVFGKEDPRSDFASEQIVDYEKTVGNDGFSFWLWVQNRAVEVMERRGTTSAADYLQV